MICLNESLNQDINSRGSDILVSVLRIVIWCIDSPEKHFAEVVGNTTLFYNRLSFNIFGCCFLQFHLLQLIEWKFRKKCSTFLEVLFIFNDFSPACRHWTNIKYIPKKFNFFLKHYQVIRASIVGFGTDEDSLTRAIIARAEIDMTKIRAEYLNANKASLDDAVIGDTSGYYLDFLMTLLGARM